MTKVKAPQRGYADQWWDSMPTWKRNTISTGLLVGLPVLLVLMTLWYAAFFHWLNEAWTWLGETVLDAAE